MKKIVVWYICLFVALGCFMNFLGVSNVGFDSALHKAVGFINGIGDASKATLKFVIGVDDVNAPGLEKLPYAYRKAYVELVDMHSSHSSELCPFSSDDKVFDYICDQFCSDFLFYVDHNGSILYRSSLNIVDSRMRDGANAFVNLFRLGKIPDDLMQELADLYDELIDAGHDDSLSVGSEQSVFRCASWLCADK